MEKKYSISKEGNHLLKIVLEGSFSIDDALDYTKDYNNVVKTISPKDYTLSFNCKNLKVSNPDVLNTLEECFKLYKKEGYNKIEAIIDAGQPVLSMQIKRVATQAGLSNLDIIKE